MSWNRLHQLFVFIVVLVKLGISSQLELSVDEAHYVNYGKRIDLSYFDHPPLVGWIQFVFQKLFGFSEVSMRFSAILIGTYLAFDLFKWVNKRSSNSELAFFISAAIQVSPIIFGLTSFLLPDSLMLICIWLLFKFFIEKLENFPSIDFMDGIFCGLLLGFAGLAKYTSILVVPGLLLLLILVGLQKSRSGDSKINGKKLGFAFFASALVALVTIFPVLFWNYKHQWISFKYQIGHVIGSKVDLSARVITLIGTFFTYGPLMIIWIGTGFFCLRKIILQQTGSANSPKHYEQNDSFPSNVVLAFTVLPFAFFVYSALTSKLLPHWMSVIFFLWLPWGIEKSWSVFKRQIKWSITLSAVMLLCVLGIVLFPIVKGSELSLRDVYGWKIIRAELNQTLNQVNPSRADLTQPKKLGEAIDGIAVTNWTFGGRALYYFEDLKKVYLIDNRYDQYDLWLSTPTKGQNFLFIDFSYDSNGVEKSIICEKMTRIKETVINKNDKEIYSVKFILCNGYQSLVGV